MKHDQVWQCARCSAWLPSYCGRVRRKGGEGYEGHVWCRPCVNTAMAKVRGERIEIAHV